MEFEEINLMHTRKKLRRFKRGASVYSTSSAVEDDSDVIDLIHKAEFGDFPGLLRLFERNPNLDVDSIDSLGRNALRLAIKNEHLEIVEFLLDRTKIENINQAALLAISLGHVQVAEEILKHPRYLRMWHERKKVGAVEYEFYNKNNDFLNHFSKETTPIILAAQMNMYEIVHLLLNRGETISIPHKYNCQCNECVNRLRFDRLKAAKSCLNSYCGLASEAYISLSSKDPILTAFTLSKELREMADIQKFFKKDYNELASNLSNYVVMLLDQVQNQKELELMVNKVGKSDEELYDNLGRLKLALRYEEKQFVSHPAIQQRLVHEWYSGEHKLEHSGSFKKFCGMLGILVFYPILLCVYLVRPKSKIGKILSYPCIKFVCHSLSFAVFITLIIISTLEQSSYHDGKFSTALPEVFSQYTKFRNTSSIDYFGYDFPLRKSKILVIEMLFMTFIIGFIVQELNQIYEGGFKEYSYSNYNIMDFCMLSLYIMCFSLRACILYKRLTCSETLQRLANATINFNTYFYQIYWLNADRFYWNKTDPENVSEALLAVANILSFARISYILPANANLGPLQISLGRMIKEILRFFLLFCLVLAAFVIGLQNLFWYYGVRDKFEVVPKNITVKARENFGDFISTFRTAFWSLFGRGEPHAVQLGAYDNSFTEDVGYVIYGLYNISMVTVLLNMLIAMMTRSFENIAMCSDAEWKYARSLLYMEYIGDSSTLPVPFNMLAIPRIFFRLCKELVCLCCCSSCKKSESLETTHNKSVRGKTENVNRGYTMTTASSITDIPHVSRQDSEDDENMTYEWVIQQVVQRYIFNEQRQKEVTEVVKAAKLQNSVPLKSTIQRQVLRQYMIDQLGLLIVMNTNRNIDKLQDKEDMKVDCDAYTFLKQTTQEEIHALIRLVYNLNGYSTKVLFSESKGLHPCLELV